MLKHTKTGPLKVSLLSISPHNRAILEFFFAGAGRNLFKVTTEQEADAIIVDYDNPGAHDEWARRTDSGKPGIILSVHQADLKNAVWIPKPLTSKALTDAASQVHELLESQQTTAPAQSSPAMTRTETTEETRPLPSAKSLFGETSPQPFGVGASPSRKLRSLIINFDDDDEDELVPVAPPLAQPVHEEPAIPAGVFDPAESDISMEEIARPSEPSISPEMAERRWRELCGEHDNAHTASAAMLFTPENYLLGNVLDALRLTRDSKQNVQIKMPNNHFALLLPTRGQVYCTLDTRSDEFSMLCNNPVQTSQVGLHIPNSAELEELESLADKNADKLFDLEAFVWVASLLTSQGRLSRNVDTNQKVALKHWPNMTRLEQFPHVMRIAALWHQRPGTPFEIATALDVPQRYVFAFHTAANILNLFELDQTKFKSREKEQPKENRGLFSRLLKRLLGGGRK